MTTTTTTTRAAYAAATDAADALARAVVLARMAHRGAIADGDPEATADALAARLGTLIAERDAARHAAALEALEHGTVEPEPLEERTVRVVLYSTGAGRRRARITAPGLVPQTCALDYSSTDPYGAAIAEAFPSAVVLARFTAARGRYSRPAPRAEVFRIGVPEVSA